MKEQSQQGKQYDHEEFHHHEKGSMKTGGLSRHEEGESGYKHPHERTCSSCKHP